MLPALIAAGADFAGNIASSAYGNYNARKNTKRANQQSFENSVAFDMYNRLYGPSLQREGLERAGYNPMLAFGDFKQGHFSSVDTADTFAPQSGNIGSSAVANQRARAERELIDAQTLETLSRIDTKTPVGRYLNDVTKWADKVDKKIRPSAYSQDDSSSAFGRFLGRVKEFLPPYRYKNKSSKDSKKSHGEVESITVGGKEYKNFRDYRPGYYKRQGEQPFGHDRFGRPLFKYRP